MATPATMTLVGVAEHEHDASEQTVVEREPVPESLFAGRFRIDAKLASGGFGSIYRATHVASGHVFALKVLHANLTSDPRVVERFRRESKALARLRDPHTVVAYDWGEGADGALYIVMELLQGETLYDRFRARGPLAWRQMMQIARDVCSSLIEAHACGIVHRDLKPTNIHLEPRRGGDFVKVLDFGIAKILHSDDADHFDLTQAGQMVGTLDYMPPEQMFGSQCTAASDVYTLGVVMYEMIAGRKPHEDTDSPTAALAAMLTSAPRRLALQAMVPPEVDQLVMRCLERQHTDRFPSAVELAAAIDRVLADGEQTITTVAPGSTSHAQTAPLPRFVLASLAQAGTPDVPEATAAATVAAVTSAVAALSEAAVTTPEPVPLGIAIAATRAAASAVAAPHEVTVVAEPVAAPPGITMTGAAAPPPIAVAAQAPPAPTPTGAAAPSVPNRPTLIGTPAPSRLAPPRRPGATPVTGTRSLRDIYPALQQPLPSPTRPPPQFEERPGSIAVTAMTAPGSYPVAPRSPARWIAVGIGIAVSISLLIALAIATL